ncbi:hypothetical protein [Cystobacter ferrugineus]|uniref:Uncharacterized protein n=1 Tax=Cystobacter ferrugineus TaxID=83449 RepID=A0A1L9AUP6_9BACT|nr:hypothetical protein [Cystobacter ferrugineus]OJH33712.1 hypothetical protein BON30_47140 [Cystobacter ferrugineus]
MPIPYDHLAVAKIFDSIAGPSPSPIVDNLHEEARQLLVRLAGMAYMKAAFDVELKADSLSLTPPSGGPPIVIGYLPDVSTFEISRQNRKTHWGMPVVYSDANERLENAHADDEESKDALVELAKFVKRLCGPDEDFSMGSVAD